MSKTIWHGASSASTNERIIYAGSQKHPINMAQLAKVARRLRFLANVRDRNGDRVIQLAAERLDHTNPWIAFRYTSDFAERILAPYLLAPSCGRGVFKPFGNGDKYTFKEFLA